MVTLLIFFVAVGLLVWGFNRARPYGQLGIFAWLQSVVLMVPWLLFFGLFTLGVYINLAGVLFLVLASAGLYIYLGRRLRAMGQDELIAKRMAKLLTTEATEEPSDPSALKYDESTNQNRESADGLASADGSSPESEDDAEEEAEFRIPAADLRALEGIFGIDTFFRTETVPYNQGVIFRGNLRGQPEETLAKLSALTEERLEDTYRLFLIQDPSDKPVVVVFPKSADPKPLTPVRKGLAVVFGLVTFLTCLEVSGILLQVDLLATPEKWQPALPFALGIVAILIAHEIGHWAIARQRGIKLSWPFFLPAWEIGSFGALTRIESVLPDRKTLFDIAFAGPAVGGVLSFGILLLGLVLSHPGSQFQLPVEFFQGSVLVGTLAKVVLGSALSEPLVDVHPLTILGWLGLVITALNLLPAGQLDGGRIVQAIYGRKMAGRATAVTLVLLGIASLANPLALYWAALILFLQRSLERPAQNELTEPDDARAALGLLALFLTLATLMPLTPTLAGRLGIG
ncbi:MAG: site-2 protease family protein [Leptolyngbyaceae cyanobacterium]